MMFNGVANKLWFKILFLLFATFLALVFGLISLTANPILIGLAVGLVVGVFLLGVPKKVIWMVLIIGLAAPTVFNLLGSGLSRMQWAVSLMGMLLLVPGIFNLINLNPNQKKSVPLFIWVALAFMLFAVFSTLLQLHSKSELIGGFKRYFQAFGLMLALASMPLERKDFDDWLKLLLGIALLQLPFALYERLILVPKRGGIDLGGGQATDVVAGTLGISMEGGSPNSVMVILVLTAFAFIFARWRQGLLSATYFGVLSALILLPLALGETKVVIVLFPVMAFTLLRKEILKTPVAAIVSFAVMVLITIGLAYLYFEIMLNTDLVKGVLGMYEYTFGDKYGYGTLLLNRGTALTFWWSAHDWIDPVSILFGHGLGSSYGLEGHIAQMYYKFGIATTTASSILWDLGIAGLALYLSIYVLAWREMSKIINTTQNLKIKADCLALQVGIAFTLIFIMYADSQVNLIVHEIIIAFMLGYAAFITREHKQNLQNLNQPV
ncbi:MAG TPA: hypothetical protein DCO68_08325 [Methylophilaceae bacterium]|nr:hypothetical protein [Methylophilaceae bacterium]HAJ72072.1 hypothetical protein [Methylophilaceae bacterium]